MASRSGIFCAILLAALYAGCGLFGPTERGGSAPTPYAPIPNALDEEYLHSPAGDVAARYPKGWLHVDISSIPMQNVLEVYTDPARERALVLAELPATAEFRRTIERDGMPALVEQSFSMKSAKRPGKFSITRPSEVYTIAGKLFASYQYGENTPDSSHRVENRVVLFTTGAKFYELSLVELTEPTEAGSHLLNFRLLESVIASLEGAAEVRGSSETAPF